MSYTPNNPDVYIAAYAGALAGMGVSDRMPVSNSFADLANIVGAFAQEFDTVWGVNTCNSFQFAAIQEACEGLWQERYPGVNPEVDAFGRISQSRWLNPLIYKNNCVTLIAMIAQASAYLGGQGIPISPVLPPGIDNGNPMYWNSSAGKWDVANPNFFWEGGLDSNNLLNPKVNAQLQGARTVDATPNVVISSFGPPPNNTLVRRSTEVFATDGAGNTAWFLWRGVWLFSGGAYTVVKAPTQLDTGSTGTGSAWSYQLTNFGTVLQGQATGQAATIIHWSTVSETPEAF